MSKNRCGTRAAIIACVAVFGLATSLPAQTATIVHRYDFEEEDGTDSVGDADGIVNGSPDFTDDAVSGALSISLFGGDYVLVDEPLDFDLEFSISLWVLPDPEALGIQNLIGNSVGGYERDGFKLFYNTWTADSSTADGRLILETGDDLNGVSTSGDVGYVSDPEWTHVGAALDVLAGTADLYVNGELYASGNINPAMKTEWPFEIGRMMGSWDLHGSMDDVQIYEGLFTPDDVDFLYNNPGMVLGEAATGLEAGDANMDYQFNQLDLVQVQIAAKYLTGQPATWGEGDWNGAPGGSAGNPPAGDGLFNQSDIIAALSAGKYLTGPYAALAGAGGIEGDNQTSIVYHVDTGELAVDAPAGTNLTSINIDSAAGIFTGDPAQNLGGSFDNDSDDNIFKATFGSSFGSLSFGNVAQPGLSEDFLVNDLTAVGSLEGGGDLGAVDLIYIPEPSTMALLGLGLVGMLVMRRRRSS